jgi:hypothetical protein
MSEFLNLEEWDKEAEKSSFNPLPDGEYIAFIYDATAGATSTGKPMIKITFKIKDGEYKNRQIFGNYIINAASWWKFRELLIGAQVDITEVVKKKYQNHYELLAGIKDKLLGQTVKLILSTREYNGNVYNDIKKVIMVTEAELEQPQSNGFGLSI